MRTHTNPWVQLYLALDFAMKSVPKMSAAWDAFCEAKRCCEGKCIEHFGDSYDSWQAFLEEVS